MEGINVFTERQTTLIFTKKKRMKRSSVDHTTILSDFSLRPFFDVEPAHLHHSLLKMEEEHGLVHGVVIDHASCCRAGI